MSPTPPCAEARCDGILTIDNYDQFSQVTRRAKQTRRYDSSSRKQAAEARRQQILKAAHALFERRGIDTVTVAQLAERGGVAESTIYALFGSKTGVLRALLTQAMFNGDYAAAVERLRTIDDPVDQLRMTAEIARSIYEGESREIGLLRGSAAFSPELKAIEREFERRRFELQGDRIDRLAAAGLLRAGMTPAQARDVVWMYTSRELYRMLVTESKWTPKAYEAWLADTLVEALTTR